MRRWIRRWRSPALLRGGARPGCASGPEQLQTEVFAYGHLPPAFSARCFTARAENRAQGRLPVLLPAVSRRYRCSARRARRCSPSTASDHVRQGQQPAGRLPLAEYSGADLLRLSPRAQGHGQVITDLRPGTQGAARRSPWKGCNGYWHGWAGDAAGRGRQGYAELPTPAPRRRRTPVAAGGEGSARAPAPGPATGRQPAVRPAAGGGRLDRRWLRSGSQGPRRRLVVTRVPGGLRLVERPRASVTIRGDWRDFLLLASRHETRIPCSSAAAW